MLSTIIYSISELMSTLYALDIDPTATDHTRTGTNRVYQ